MRTRTCTALLALLLSLGSVAGHAGAEDPPRPQPRPFAMGFNPWFYDATLEAMEWTYRAINEKGDVISHHMEEGVPWPEVAADAPFAKDFAESIDQRIRHTAAGKKILLSLNPINPGRDGLAFYRGSSINQPLPVPWDRLELDSPEVKSAYFKYLTRLIDQFKPDWLAIGIEVNLLARNQPALWPKYVDLHRFVYQHLKESHPNLPLLVSIDSNAALPGYSTMDDPGVQKQVLDDLLPLVDCLGISLHPFLSTVHFANTLPDDMFDRIFALTDKPVLITETSYCAQPWTLQVNGATIEFAGSPEKQRDFLVRLLQAAQRHRALAVVLFTIRDYDALWNALGKSDLALPWRDTGLYDEAGAPRPALAVWEEALRRPRE